VRFLNIIHALNGANTMRLGESVTHFHAELNVDKVVRLYDHVVVDKKFGQLPIE
jgi:hypothetical protein